MMRSRHVEAETGCYPPALRLTGAAIQFAAERADPLTHPGQATTGGAGFPGAARTVEGPTPSPE